MLLFRALGATSRRLATGVLTRAAFNTARNRLLPSLVRGNILQNILILSISIAKIFYIFGATAFTISLGYVFWFCLCQLVMVGNVQLHDVLSLFSNLTPNEVSKHDFVFAFFHYSIMTVWVVGKYMIMYSTATFINHGGQIIDAYLHVIGDGNFTWLNTFGAASGAFTALVVTPVCQTLSALLNGDLRSLTTTGMIPEILSWPVNIHLAVTQDIIWNGIVWVWHWSGIPDLNVLPIQYPNHWYTAIIAVIVSLYNLNPGSVHRVVGSSVVATFFWIGKWLIGW